MIHDDLTDEERVHLVETGELPGSFATAEELGLVPDEPSELDALRAENDRLREELSETKRELARLHNDNERLRAIEQAAINLDTHRDEGYATLVSYLIRLHDALANTKRA